MSQVSSKDENAQLLETLKKYKNLVESLETRISKQDKAIQVLERRVDDLIRGDKLISHNLSKLDERVRYTRDKLGTVEAIARNAASNNKR